MVDMWNVLLSNSQTRTNCIRKRRGCPQPARWSRVVAGTRSSPLPAQARCGRSSSRRLLAPPAANLGPYTPLHQCRMTPPTHIPPSRSRRGWSPLQTGDCRTEREARTPEKVNPKTLVPCMLVVDVVRRSLSTAVQHAFQAALPVEC